MNNDTNISKKTHKKNPRHLPMEIPVLAWKQTHTCGGLNQLMYYIILTIHLIIWIFSKFMMWRVHFSNKNEKLKN